MSRVKVTSEVVYKFSELSDKAKEQACEWYTRDLPDSWSEFIYEDATRIAEILGIELKANPVRLMNGKTRMEPCIYWTGFWSQGDGACFEGSYKHGGLSAEKIREYAPQDEVLHKIADRLDAVQEKYLYKLTATVQHQGHYYHEHCTEIDVELDIDPDFDLEGTDLELKATDAEEVCDCLRDFMRWIYRALEREYEYQTSEEAVAEACEANEYEFTEDGHPA